MSANWAHALLAHPVALLYREPVEPRQRYKPRAPKPTAAELAAQRMGVLLDHIRRQEPGRSVSMRGVAAATGWQAGVREAFSLAVSEGLLTVRKHRCGNDRYYRTERS